MDSAASTDRRQAYRYSPPPIMEPIVTVIDRGSRARAHSVVDINLRGARLAFKGEDAPHLAAGQTVTIAMQAPGLDGAVDIKARVVFSAKQDHRHVVAVVFTNLPDIDDRVDAAFFSVFNRRQDERPDCGMRINAVVLADNSDDSEPTGFEIRVVNHTNKGMGFVVNRALDRLINGRDAIELAIQTQDRPEPRHVSARILHRAMRTDTVYYGCIFNTA